MTMRFDMKKRKRQRMVYPLNFVEIHFDSLQHRVGLSSGTVLFPSPYNRIRSPFGMTRPSGSNEAARRADLEEAGHENKCGRREMI
jgi:hypothetical protein